MTGFGFWLVEAESRKTSGCPWTSCSKIGKSRRMTSGTSLPSRMRPPNSVVPVLAGAAVRGIRAPSRVRPRGLALAGVLTELRGLRDEERLVPGVGRQPRLARDGPVAMLLEPKGQILAAALDDAALCEDVDHVRSDVVQQSLVVRDQQHAQARVEHRVHAIGDDPQRVDVEARVR